MSTPYIGQIILFGGNFAIAGWARCNGQSLSIADNNALFSLLGTTYGGEGITTFKLPDLRSRTPWALDKARRCPATSWARQPAPRP